MAAMQQLLTCKKRLDGFRGDWEEKKLGDICATITTGKLDANAMKQDGKYRFYTCAREHYYINNYAFDDEVLLVSGNGANVGYIHYYNGKFNAYQRTYVLIGFNEDIVFIKLFMEVNLSKRIRAEVNSGNTPYITMDTLTDMVILVPPTLEQQAIAKILTDMDNELEVLKTKFSKIKAIKSGMMSELLSGKTRLALNDNKTTLPKHNQHYEDAVIIGMLTSLFATENYPLGRKRYTKLSYLLHRYKSHSTDNYLKKAAGPYNPQTKYSGAEKIALSKHFIENHKNSQFEGFVASSNHAEAQSYFYKWFGEAACKWIEQFKYTKNDELELLATIDMAMQDLIKINKEMTLANVKNILRSNSEWKAKLEREIFSDTHIKEAMQQSINLFGCKS